MTDDASKEMNDFMRCYIAQIDQRRSERFAKLRSTILPVLRRLNVATVAISYDGYGDSTDECTLVFRNAQGAEVSVSVDENELIDVMFEAVPPGYENNEGGYGEVVLNVQDGSIKNSHSQRYMEVSHSEQEYKL
jgi:hypothetical protein